MTRKVYRYNVSRDGRWWLIHVPELDGMSQARFLGEIGAQVRDLISIWIEQPTESFDVEGTMTLPGTVDDRLNTALTLWLEADLEAGRAAQELRDAGVNVADIGRLLGVSRVIARKLLVNADGVDDASSLADQPTDPSKRRHTDAEIEDASGAFVDAAGADRRWRALMARPGRAGRVAAIRAQMAAADVAHARTGSAMTTGTDGNVESWADHAGPFYDTATVADMLGVSVSALRGRRSRGSVLALRTGSGSWVYPVWQFGPDGQQVLPGLVQVLRVLGGSHVSMWTAASWLKSPETELDGRTPLQVLLAGGEDDLVLLVAGHAAAGWA